MRCCEIGCWMDLLDLRAILRQLPLVVNAGKCDAMVAITTARLICTRAKLAVDTCHPVWVSHRQEGSPKQRRPASTAMQVSPSTLRDPSLRDPSLRDQLAC